MTDSGQRDNPANHEQNNSTQYKCFLCKCVATALCWVIVSLKKVDSLITAIATALLAVITLALALIAYWQYSDTTLHESLVANNRAWIAPEGAIATGDVIGGKDDISVKVFYINIGKGPATRVNSVYTFGTADNKEHASDAIIVGPNNTCVSLEPKDDGAVAFPTKLIHQNTSVPRQSISPAVKANKEVIFLQGCIIYETMKEIHHSWFCFIIYRDGILATNATTLCGDGQGAE